MESLVNGVGLPILVSAVVALGGQFVSNSTNGELLARNIDATEKLTLAVQKLETSMAVVLDRQERGEKNGR